MTNLSDIRKTILENKPFMVAKYGLNTIAIFGSVGRGQATEESDIDILVDFTKPIGIAFIDLAEELEHILHHKVDLVSRNGVKPEYLKQIEADLQYV